VGNGWSTLVLNTSAIPNTNYKDENTQLLEEYNSMGGGGGGAGVDTVPANMMMKQVMSGIHWSSWYRLFKTSADTCTKISLDSEWSKLMLRFFYTFWQHIQIQISALFSIHTKYIKIKY
jgi:hypothetical protein